MMAPGQMLPDSVVDFVFINEPGFYVYEFVGDATIDFATRGVTLFADFIGELTLEPLADNFFGSFGFVGTVNVSDVWFSAIDANVIGRFEGNLMNAFDVSARVVAQMDYQGDNASVNLGALGSGQFSGDNLTLGIGTLFGDLTVAGSGHDVSIGDADGAPISLQADGSSLAVGGGISIVDNFGAGNTIVTEGKDAIVFDFGRDTSIRNGEGDSFTYLGGTGLTLAAGHDGDDTFFIQHTGQAVISGGRGADFFEFASPASGETVITDFYPLEDGGVVYFGGVTVDLAAALDVFGEQMPSGATSFDVGGGRISVFEVDAPAFSFPEDQLVG